MGCQRKTPAEYFGGLGAAAALPCIADGVATRKSEMRIIQDRKNVYNDELDMTRGEVMNRRGATQDNGFVDELDRTNDEVMSHPGSVTRR